MSFSSRILAFLQRHPAICLLLLSSDIPGYISGSSPMNVLVLNPVMLAFQILPNRGFFV